VTVLEAAATRPLVTTARVRDFAPGEGAPDFDGGVEVPVPGDLHTALIEAGRIPHPFLDRNEDEVAWMEEREWWYRMRFAASEGAEELVFHGLDTFATVYLNGEPLGAHANMFRPAVFPVAGRLRPENELAVRFDPPAAHAGPPLEGQWGPNELIRVWMRKAQYGYGWDWGPRLPTIGICGPVELRRTPALRGVRFTTLRADAREALVEVEVDATGGEATVELRPPVGEPLTAVTTGRARFVLAEPALWWTHDLGEPALHQLTVTLGEERYEAAVGVRTLELDQRPDPDEPGTRFFRFRLNGVGLFARGANWIPAHSFHAAVERGRYERLLTDARDAHMNMIRVWGGGLYEYDAFYELCDELGLLVWQDFMFACAMYPEDELAEEVELEARHQVARLRNHASLALWCGNNENQWIHDMAFPDNAVNRVPGARFYDEILPRAVAELDPATPYWPGSPFGGNDHNGREDGDVHNWEVWHGNHPRRFGEVAHREPTPESVSFTRYAEDTGRFISEFGTLSAPDRETLRRWIPEDELYHHSPAMDHHTKDTPKNKIDMLLESVTGVAEDLDEFVDFSQIAQAEAMKFGIEHYRRRAPHCSGTLIWQLNDTWPGLSWALVDHHGFGKAAYHFVRRAYAPVLASFKVAGGVVELWVTNDTGSRVRDEARVRLGRFAGEPLREEAVAVDVPAHTSARVARWEDMEGGPDRYLVVRGGSFPANRHFFAAIKDLARERPRVEHDVRGREVRLRADAYAYFVQVAVADETIRFSDNFVELEPGEERTITLSAPIEDLAIRSR
jgi:beta-mannosidase